MEYSDKRYSPVRSTYTRVGNNIAFCVLSDTHDWRKQAKEYCNKYKPDYVYLPDKRYLYLDDDHPVGVTYGAEPYDFKSETINYYFHYIWKRYLGMLR